MIKDRIILGSIVGLLANVVKLTVNYLSFLLGFTPVVFWQLVATRFLQKQDLYKPSAYLIGAVADITVTMTLGVVFVYFIYIFGRKYLLIKSVGFALLVWVGLFGTLLGQSIEDKLPQQPQGIIVTIAAHFAFGIGLAAFTRLLDRNFDEPSSENQGKRWIPWEPAKKPAVKTYRLKIPKTGFLKPKKIGNRKKT
ncbi:MAG: hypothetical protein AB1420_12120 [Bacillota bacterium]